MNQQTVLSLFSGLGLLDLGFQRAGFCILRGPDLLWNSDIKDFKGYSLEGKIDGVIGGVPCQRFSNAVENENKKNHPDLWPEFWRVVSEIKPKWVFAENVPGSIEASNCSFYTPSEYLPMVDIWLCSDLGSAQKRKRLFLFGCKTHTRGNFFEVLKSLGSDFGKEWRNSIDRNIDSPGKYATIIGDSHELRNSGTGKPSRYIKGDDLLDAFDLPKDFSLPKHARISRATFSRLITQGVPVSAAYAIAKTIKEIIK